MRRARAVGAPGFLSQNGVKMFSQERAKELDILEMIGRAAGIEEEDLVLEEIPDSIYRIAKRLNKPVTPPDLSRELPTLSKICGDSARDKTILIAKAQGGDLFYIVWGVIVIGTEERIRVSHLIQVG